MSNGKIETAITLIENEEGSIEEVQPIADSTGENQTSSPPVLVDERDALIEEAEEQIKRQDSIIKEQGAVIEKLTEQLKGYVQGSISITSDEPKKPSIPTETVQIDGVEYGFLKPLFNIKGTTYKAEEAMSNEAVLRAVLAINGQNILRELV